jgi:hypothetical protein
MDEVFGIYKGILTVEHVDCETMEIFLDNHPDDVTLHRIDLLDVLKKLEGKFIAIKITMPTDKKRDERQ